MKKELSVGESRAAAGCPFLRFISLNAGLIASERTSANHRVYRREILRRVTAIKIAQSASRCYPTSQAAVARIQLASAASAPRLCERSTAG